MYRNIAAIGEPSGFRFFLGIFMHMRTCNAEGTNQSENYQNANYMSIQVKFLKFLLDDVICHFNNHRIICCDREDLRLIILGERDVVSYSY